MNILEAKVVAQEIDRTIGQEDFYIRKRYRIIALQHIDGTRFEFHRAAFRQLDKKWVAIFTEHHGFYAYNVEDVEYIQEWNSGAVLY